MRKWLVVLALILILSQSVPAYAQSTVIFDTFDISVWPEYDTPTVLVINKISLPQQASLPAEVTLRIPAGVGKIYTVAVGSTAATVSDSGVDYKFTPGTDFSQVTIKAAARFIQMEYYDPGLIKNASQRDYAFEWLGDYKVNNFRFELRQPLQSSNLTVEPALTNTVLDREGFQFSEYKMSGLEVGQKQVFKIKYQRETDSPSTSFLQVQPSTPLDQNISGQSTWTTYLPWGLGGLGLALLLIAGYIYWSSGKSSRATGASRKRHSTGQNSSVESSIDGNQQVHCAQCGKRAQAGDRFCRACGGRIRRNED
ncbi:MAG: zinc ribbon domain-containing protein [Chloroflexota bacterium]